MEERNVNLASSNLASTLLTFADAEWRHGTNPVRRAGPITAYPGYSYSRESGYSADRWVLGSGPDRREFELRLFDIGWTGRPQDPLVVVDDHPLELVVHYATPQPTLTELELAITNTTIDRVRLAPVMAVTPESKLQQRTLTRRELEITTRYYWPREPGGTGAGYTAPLIAWAGTTITGLTSRPMTLAGEFSQTYRPGHHNISEDYLFDPWLPETDRCRTRRRRSRHPRSPVRSRCKFSWAVAFRCLSEPSMPDSPGRCRPPPRRPRAVLVFDCCMRNLFTSHAARVDNSRGDVDRRFAKHECRLIPDASESRTGCVGNRAQHE